MSAISLHILSPSRAEQVDGVTSFVGRDTSGSFGILPGHGRFMTILDVGLARYRTAMMPWQYLAVPGALLYIADNRLTITARRYLRDENYERISNLLEEEMRAEERKMQATKESLRRMEEEILRRLWGLRRERR